MKRARVVFGSDSNKTHFALDLSERSDLVFSGVTLESDAALVWVYPGKEGDIEDFVNRYGGELLWVEID